MLDDIGNITFPVSIWLMLFCFFFFDLKEISRFSEGQYAHQKFIIVPALFIPYFCIVSLQK